MASAKETPRQRMVGMMYLVLTALLALQVSSALIYKFQALNESLEKSSEETSGWNEKKLVNIESEIKNRGSDPKEVKLLNNAKLITQKSKEMKSFIEGLKKDLIMQSGGYNEDGSLKGAKEETKVEVVMIGANKNGKAYELKKILNDYVDFINENSETKFTWVALDGKEDPLFKNNSEQKNKDFAELNFGQTPLVASLAILSEYQSRVSTMEATTLTALAEKVGSLDIPVDNVRPMVSPVSRVVAAGMKYEAQLFMAATSSSVKPKMELGSNAIIVDDNGIGKVSFVASGGSYDPSGLSKKVWTGKVTMRMPGGRDSTFIVTEEYMVAKPVIEIKAAAVQALYRNCGNKLNIQVPALGNSYNPRIKADGANVISGSNRGMVTVVPTGTSVTLKVNNDGNFIGEEKFRVKLIPLPTIDIKVDGKKPDQIKGVPPTVRTIKLTPIPDKDFAEFLPDDAGYAITKVRVRKARSGRGLQPVEFTSGFINLGQLASDLLPNDKFIIEVLELKRRNFRGDWELVKMPETLTTFSVDIH